MKTFQELQADCAQYVLAPTDPEALAVAGSGINDAIHFLNSINWNFQLQTSGFALSTSAQQYPLPADFKAPRELNYLNTSGTHAGFIPYYEPKLFDRKFNMPVPLAGWNPQGYTVVNPWPSGVILLDRIPTTSFVNQFPSGEFRYYSRIADLASPTDRLAVPPEVESMVMWKAKSYLAAIYSPEKVDYAERNWTALYRQLRRDQVESSVTDW